MSGLPLDSLGVALLEALSDWGPGLLFLLAVGETSFVTGLVVPSGVATSIATVLAGQGILDYPDVALAALAGGWCGDSVGYWIGRRWGERLIPTEGRLGRRVRDAYDRAAPWLGRHPVYSVTVARLVSFVRTVMPLGAGASGIAYPRFLAFEAVGVTAWVAMYMAAGALAGEGWQRATSLLGAGWLVVFAVAGVILWRRRSRRRVAGRGRPASGGTE